MSKRKSKKDRQAKLKAQNASSSRLRSEKKPLMGSPRGNSYNDITPRWLEDYNLLPDEPLFGEYLEMSK